MQLCTRPGPPAAARRRGRRAPPANGAELTDDAREALSHSMDYAWDYRINFMAHSLHESRFLNMLKGAGGRSVLGARSSTVSPVTTSSALTSRASVSLTSIR